jgi:nucleoside-diphosphate-sugar epimerase
VLYDLTYNSNTEDLDCKKIRGDINDYDSVKKAVYGVDAVFHLAAVSRVVWGQEDPLKCWQTNVQGTVNLLEACRRVGKNPVFFYASSREVYGEPNYSPVDESHPKNPKSVYGMSKLSAENACLAYSINYGLDVVRFRFSNVYGSERDQLDRVIPKFMIRALRGDDITLYGGGQILDFTFIDDTVDGITSAYLKTMKREKGVFGEDFHLVTGNGTSVYELSDLIVKVTDSTSQVVRIEGKSFDVRKFTGDPTKSRKILGFESKTSLEEGLRKLRKISLENNLHKDSI